MYEWYKNKAITREIGNSKCTNHKLNGAEACKQLYVTEENIIKAYQIALGNLINEADKIKETLKSNIVTSLDDSLAIELAEVLEKIDVRQAEMIKLHREKRTKAISEEEYNHAGSKLSTEIELLISQKILLQSKADSSKLSTKRIEEIFEYLDNKNITAEFDGDTFKNLVEEMTITGNRELEIKFKVGITQIVKL